MKRMTLFVMALAMVLGLAQCKKDQPVTPDAQGVTITLNVGDNNSGEKVNVTPYPTGDNDQVTFTDGDQILVASGGKYIGMLTRTGGIFSGEVFNPVEDQPLYFYFLGNKAYETALEAGTTTECTVNISDQTGELPVISMGQSRDANGKPLNYQDGMTSFYSRLYNKASLMKFNVTTPSEAAICITGMNNTVTVNFGQPTEDNYGFTYGKDDAGLIMMAGQEGTGEKTYWAIVLPQAELAEGEEGSIYSFDNSYIGTRPVIHAIEVNKFYNSGIAMTVSTHVWNGDLSVLTANDPEGFATATDGMTIYGTLNANVKVSIADGATVTLSNATITGTNSDSYLWAGITCLGDATIMLADGTTNNVTSFYEDYPGIHIASGKTLTIQGSGTLNASSNGGVDGWGAGIGGSDLVDCGNIVINSGTINATGGIWMAGIGGGFDKNCGSITINGGNVTATGGRGAAGIGTGVSQVNITCGDISITGGIVNATGGRGAAGIGSGFVTFDGIHNTCGNISITGGQVTATGGDGGDHVYPDILTHNSWANYTYYGGAGIGTGSTANSNYEEGSSSCGTITIGSGVTSVTATKGGGTRPATNSIGKNESIMNQGTCGTITIGGTVYPDGATPNQADGLTFVYPVQETTITWNSSTVNGINISNGSFTNSGITVTSNSSNAKWNYSGLISSIDLENISDKLTFSTGDGTIKEIVITLDPTSGSVDGTPSSGWSYAGLPYYTLTWTGSSSSVDLSGVSSKGFPGGGGIGPITSSVLKVGAITKVEFTVLK